MELIRINAQKLKIMLTPSDMCHFDLDNENLGEDSARMHRAFRLLFDEIRQQTDFDADDNRLSIQYFPSKEGGCEMFVSRLQEDGRETEEANNVAPLPVRLSREALQLRPQRKNGGSFKRECAYRFGCLSELLYACRRLHMLGFLCESAAYRDERRDYFLILTVFTATPFTTPEELDFLVEYGQIENAAVLRIYIKEHASTICETNAVARLASLA